MTFDWEGACLWYSQNKSRILARQHIRNMKKATDGNQ